MQLLSLKAWRSLFSVNIPLLINTKISDWKSRACLQRLLAGACYGLPMSPETATKLARSPRRCNVRTIARFEVRGWPCTKSVSPNVSGTWEGHFCGLRGWMIIGLNRSLCGILSGSKSRSTGATSGNTDRKSEEHTSELQSLRHLVCRL